MGIYCNAIILKLWSEQTDTIENRQINKKSFKSCDPKLQ
jgi:hypothetical protein